MDFFDCHTCFDLVDCQMGRWWKGKIKLPGSSRIIFCRNYMHPPTEIFRSKIWTTLIAFCISLYSQASFAQWGGSKEWMDLIRQDCSPTFKGQAKKLINERSYWVETNVSMHFWIEGMRLDRFDDFCRDTYSHPSQRDRLLSCLASVQHDFDWFGRCKNQIVYKCRTAGGFCN